MVYVMLSRVCSLDQMMILNEFDETKMFPSKIALIELERLNKISKNQNPTQWEEENDKVMKISSLNCRSLNKHHSDLMTDG